ncbi:MAG: TIGR03915 family putative DNA repair protein, partial [Bacteroidota bacterium]|nr:TIGR03915 family putative DNA repair protein [Bacteroidota bacterium]
GLLTAVFDSYSLKIIPDILVSQKEYQDYLWANKFEINTDIGKAERVWKGLEKKLSSKNINLPFRIFLSEENDNTRLLFDFIRLVFDSHHNIETDYGNPVILTARQAERKVLQEACRMLQFVRFQKTGDDIYFSGITPAFDVLPLIVRHFEDRFADQKWVLYDMKRDYGFYYDLKGITEITLREKQFDSSNGELHSDTVAENEIFYQRLWKNYFDHICISERINPKLQKNHMPRRYWKFLPEKRL